MKNSIEGDYCITLWYNEEQVRTTAVPPLSQGIYKAKCSLKAPSTSRIRSVPKRPTTGPTRRSLAMVRICCAWIF